MLTIRAIFLAPLATVPREQGPIMGCLARISRFKAASISGTDPLALAKLVAAISMTIKLTHLPEKPSSPLKMALFTERPDAEFPSSRVSAVKLQQMFLGTISGQTFPGIDTGPNGLGGLSRLTLFKREGVAKGVPDGAATVALLSALRPSAGRAWRTSKLVASLGITVEVTRQKLKRASAKLEK